MESSDPVRNIAPSKELAWYIPDLSERVTSESRRLLEEYGGTPAKDVLPHIHEIRDKAWAIRPYPCTGLGTFLQPTISLLPVYSEIIKTLKSGGSFLDIGCFLGQDLRQLVSDGAPSECLYGVDVVSHWHLGYELFNDENKFKAHFMEADLLEPSAELSALEGKIDIIQVAHVLHQWGWEGQIEAANFSKLGSLIVGLQAGTAGGTTREPGDSQYYSWMRQDPESWAEMWDVVGKETGTEWKSDAVLLAYNEIGVRVKDVEYLGPLSRILQFVVTRIK